MLELDLPNSKPKPNANLYRPTPHQLREIGQSYATEPGLVRDDMTLSHAAYRLLRMMLGMPDTWQFRQADFARRMGVSTRQIGRWWRELVDHDQMRIERSSLGGGRWSYHYTISALPFAMALKALKKEPYDTDSIREFEVIKEAADE